MINKILDNRENMPDKELLETVLTYKKSHPGDDNKLYTYDEFIASGLMRYCYFKIFLV